MRGENCFSSNGRVFIGMLDPNPDIHGHGITYLQNNNVEVDFFDLDLVQKIQNQNKDFIKQYERIEAASEMLETQCEEPSDMEKQCMSSATIEDLNRQMIKGYLDARNQAFEIFSPEMLKFLAKNGFLGSYRRKRTYMPTVSGLLLFGKNPEDFMVQCKIKGEADIGERTVTSDIIGPLLSLPEKIKEFLEKNMRTFTEIREFERVKVPEYPWEAIREAIVNAIVHRDYGEGARILIRITQENLIIKSRDYLFDPFL